MVYEMVFIGIFRWHCFLCFSVITCIFQCVGGTFALYSLLCRHAKIHTIPNQHRTDEDLTTYSRNAFHEHSYAAKTKRWLEKYASRKHALLVLVLVGTCMVIGDGILTPAISGITYFSFHIFVSSTTSFVLEPCEAFLWLPYSI